MEGKHLHNGYVTGKKNPVEMLTKGLPRRDVWEISIIAGSAKERTGYPTQKPLALMERIKSSSNEGDTVLDPFCGSGTTLVAAERLGRKWIGIDRNQEAMSLAEERLRKERGVFGANWETEGT